MMRRAIVCLCFSLSLALPACGGGGIREIQAKTEKIETKEELQKVLGRANKISGGTVKGFSPEIHIYETSDGVAQFTILNGKIKQRMYTPRPAK